jgi:hypothetical protein
VSGRGEGDLNRCECVNGPGVEALHFPLNKEGCLKERRAAPSESKGEPCQIDGSTCDWPMVDSAR